MFRLRCWWHLAADHAFLELITTCLQERVCCLTAGILALECNDLVKVNALVSFGIPFGISCSTPSCFWCEVFIAKHFAFCKINEWLLNAAFIVFPATLCAYMIYVATAILCSLEIFLAHLNAPLESVLCIGQAIRIAGHAGEC